MPNGFVVNSLRTFLSIRRRVRQKATRYSLLVVILLFGLFLEAYMHNFNLVYITLFFVFASAFAAGPVGMLNIGRLDAEFTGCTRLFARERGTLFFRIFNPASTDAWAVEIHVFDTVKTVKKIAAGTSIRAGLAITPPKRGRISPAPCSLQSLFPLATVRFVLPLETSCECIVYPQPRGEPLQSFLLRSRAPFGDETDFAGVRAYDGGISASRMHWPSLAKGETAAKTFEREHASETLHFVFERCGSDTESRLSQLTLWVLECERQQRRYTIEMPHTVLHGNKENTDAILTALALF